jgi:uncharacterized integral membrane protein
MVRNIIFVCLIGVVLVFVVQNIEVVEFQFLAWTISTSRAFALFGTLAIGFVAGCLLTLPRGRKQQQDKRKGRK